MSNVTPLKIDITDGRLPIKEKGLVWMLLKERISQIYIKYKFFGFYYYF